MTLKVQLTEILEDVSSGFIHPDSAFKKIMNLVDPALCDEWQDGYEHGARMMKTVYGDADA